VLEEPQLVVAEGALHTAATAPPAPAAPPPVRESPPNAPVTTAFPFASAAPLRPAPVSPPPPRPAPPPPPAAVTRGAPPFGTGFGELLALAAAGLAVAVMVAVVVTYHSFTSVLWLWLGAAVVFTPAVFWRARRLRTRGSRGADWTAIAAAWLVAVFLLVQGFVAHESLTAVASAFAVITAATIWTTRAVLRPRLQRAGDVGPAPPLAPTPIGIAGVVVVGTFAVLELVSWLENDNPFTFVVGLMLFAAAALRVYRLAQPGPQVLDRLAAALAAAAAGAAASWVIVALTVAGYTFDFTWVLIEGGPAVLALGAAVSWLRR
jgi:hypothetical protein